MICRSDTDREPRSIIAKTDGRRRASGGASSKHGRKRPRIPCTSWTARSYAHTSAPPAGNGGRAAHATGRSRGDLTTKIQADVDGCVLPFRLLLTRGQASDKTTAPDLVGPLKLIGAVVGDRGYFGQAVIAAIEASEATARIPSQSNLGAVRTVDRSSTESATRSSGSSIASDTSAAMRDDTSTPQTTSWLPYTSHPQGSGSDIASPRPRGRRSVNSLRHALGSSVRRSAFGRTGRPPR